MIGAIGERVASLGATALVIGDDVVLGIVAERMRESLDTASVDGDVEEFGGECSTTEIDRVGEIARDVGADVIVGVGGRIDFQFDLVERLALDVGQVLRPGSLVDRHA